MNKINLIAISKILKKKSSFFSQNIYYQGFEKRLIDNILIDSLRCAGRTVYTDEKFTEAERLKLNIEEFLEWTVPNDSMKNFKEGRKSVEEILEQLVEGFN